MSAEWPLVPLGNLTVNLDSRRKPVKEADRKPGPYPYYGASGIVDYVDGYLFEGDHLLIAEDGENLRTRQLPIAFMATGKFWVNNHAHIVVGNDKADTQYLMYALRNTDISGFLTGAVMPKLTQGNLNRIPLPCPSIDIQRDIVQILGSLDDKIEINRQINQTLEQMAQAIFKSWFVDFDPVHAKVQAIKEGRDPIEAAARVIGNPAIEQVGASLREIAELFPSEFVESELGLIPKRWGVKPVSDWGRVVCGKTPSKNMPKYYGADVPFIKIPDMHANMFATHTTDSLSDLGSKSQFNKQVPKGSVCVSCIATVGKVVIATQDSHTNQQINSIVPSKPYYTPYLYFTMKELSGHLHDLASGGSATLNLNTGNFSKIKTVFPTDSVLSSYSSVASRLMDKILNGYSSNSHWLNCATSCSPSSSPARSVSVMSNSMFGQYNDESVETVEIYR